MPIIAPTPALPLPDPPDTADIVNFDLRGDAFNAHLHEHTLPEFNALAANVYNNAQETKANADDVAEKTAATAANAALAAGYAGATAWLSGTVYAIGDKRYSLINGRVHRRLTAGAGVTDPSADAVNWQIDNAAPLLLVVVAGAAQAVVAGYHYAFTNLAATTATAPAAAAPGDRFATSTCNGLTTNTINWNGLKHEGIADATMKLDDKKYHEFVYISAAFGWKVTV